LPFIPNYIQLSVSLILIVTGFFNISAGKKKNRFEQTAPNKSGISQKNTE